MTYDAKAEERIRRLVDQMHDETARMPLAADFIGEVIALGTIRSYVEQSLFTDAMARERIREVLDAMDLYRAERANRGAS